MHFSIDMALFIINFCDFSILDIWEKILVFNICYFCRIWNILILLIYSSPFSNQILITICNICKELKILTLVIKSLSSISVILAENEWYWYWLYIHLLIILGNSLHFWLLAKKREKLQISCKKARKLRENSRMIFPLLLTTKN